MTNSDQTHPLGDEETDQINPAVADGLTPEQLDFFAGNRRLLVEKSSRFFGRHFLSGSVSIWSIVLPKPFLRIPFAARLRNSCTGIVWKLKCQKRIAASAVPRSHETGR